MNQCDDNLEHPDDMHSTCMQKDPAVSIRLFDRNFMLCCAYLHSVNRTSRWHKSGQDINHLPGNMTQHARTADTGTLSRISSSVISRQTEHGAEHQYLHCTMYLCVPGPVFWNGVTR